MGIANLVLVLIAVASTARAYLQRGALSDRVATHFDLAGQPNGWMSKDAFLSVHVTMFAIVLAIFLGMRAFLRRVPIRLVNLPGKHYWLAPERREASIERVGE